MQTTSAAPQAKLLAAYAAPEILFALCMDRRQGTLYGGGTSAAVHTAAVNSQEKAAAVAWTNHRNYISGLAFVAGAAFDDVVVSAGFDRQLVWTRACDGVPVRALVAHDAWIRDLALFPDGSRLATVGDDMRLKVWETATGRLIHVLEGHSRQTPQGYATSLYCVAVSPDGHYLASGDRIGEVCLWEAATGKLLQRLKTPEFYTYDAARRVRSIGGIRSVAFRPTGGDWRSPGSDRSRTSTVSSGRAAWRSGIGRPPAASSSARTTTRPC